MWLILWFIYYDSPEDKNVYHSLSIIIFIVIWMKKEIQKSQVQNYHGGNCLGYKQTWAFAIGKFLTDPVWWFYLFWLPDFLESEYGIKGTAVALPVALVYTLSTIGSIGGGWLPMNLMRNGWPVFKARKTSMLIYAFFVVPVVFAQILGDINLWLAVMIIGLAAAAHQAWSANIFTTVSDMFPKNATASVTGLGGMFGALGGILLTAFVQKNLFVHYREINQIETAYYIMFFICGGAYLLAWVIMHLLVPRMQRIEV